MQVPRGGRSEPLSLCHHMTYNGTENGARRGRDGVPSLHSLPVPVRFSGPVRERTDTLRLTISTEYFRCAA